MKKIRLVGAMVLLIALLAGMTAYAMDGSFDFTFYNVTTEAPNSSFGYRATAKGPGRDWQVRITSGNVSNTNILGMRPRKSPEGDALGPYHLYSYVGTYNLSYTNTVQCGATRPVYLRAKKDNTSTSNTLLNVEGRYTP